MATLTVPEETYQRLSRRAAALKVSVEDLIQPVLDQLAADTSSMSESPRPLEGDAWFAEFEALVKQSISRADRYPPGFVVNDSRDTIYGEREDAQL